MSNTPCTPFDDTFRNKLAEKQHAIWAHWMTYLFSVSKANDDGTYTIPQDKVSRWQRQIAVHYNDLSVEEKASDLEQADRIIALLHSWLMKNSP